MESKLMIEIGKRVESGEGVALVTLIQIDGSSPGKKGNMLAVFENGGIMGTVGGGNLEFTLTKEAINCIKENESKEIEFDLVEDAALHMKCGGSVKAFIKVFKKRDRLVIVGGGHVGGELYQVADFLGMDIWMLDDREEFCNSEKYPHASKHIVGDIGVEMSKLKINEYTYIVIVSRGHRGDKDALRACIGRGAKYIGMIGSRKKIIETNKELMEEGISKEELQKVFSPVGLDISSGTPKEIAVGIIAEILKEKNNLTGKPMRDVKGVW